MTLETPSSKGRRNWRAGRNPQRGFGLVEKMFYYYSRIKSSRYYPRRAGVLSERRQDGRGQ